MAHWHSFPLDGDRRCSVDLLTGDDFATAHLLRERSALPRIGRHGNIIAIPSRDMILSVPLERGPSGRAMDGLLAVANGRFRSGGRALVPHLYWRSREGAFHPQGQTEHGQTGRFEPSPELHEVLVNLQRRRPHQGPGT
jgi:hypothetical protein